MKEISQSEFTTIVEFARQFFSDPKVKSIELRQAIVTEATRGVYSVILGGATFAISGIRSFSIEQIPVGETVWLLKYGPDMIVLGRIATEESAFAPVNGYIETASGHAVNDVIMMGKLNASGEATVSHGIQAASLRTVSHSAVFRGNSGESVAALSTRVDANTFYVNGGSAEAHDRGWRGIIRYTRDEFPWIE